MKDAAINGSSMEKLKINDLYTLSWIELKAMLNDFLCDLGVSDEAITPEQVEELSKKLMDRLDFEADPKKWGLNPESSSKQLKFCTLPPNYQQSGEGN